ncbi:hypothetical protein Nepgr_021462 [Nepenthes gracilis]|uniref:BHLH domain-containing protein n=1 Tax=Nepenthes gracilis TaxID=150966 RepID=A0AAD3XXD8_NEPGR|nr:hypothetical protein Nepgr_021462 [Nepenthes gracilis]
MGDNLASIFEDPEFGESILAGGASPEDLFSIFDALDGVLEVLPDAPVNVVDGILLGGLGKEGEGERLVYEECDAELGDVDASSSSPKTKRPRLVASVQEVKNSNPADGHQRMSHITLERNRRKQMNDHLSVLRCLVPCFYVKRGDQASIIGGVVDYINELQQILQSLEAKKQRKVYSEILSPRASPVVSPRKPPLTPRTPQQRSPYGRRMQQGAGYLSPAMANPAVELSPSSSSSSSSIDKAKNDLVAKSKSPVAEVEVKFCAPNVLLKTVSPKIPGQVIKIISAIEDLSLRVLHVNISSVDETMLHCFTIEVRHHKSFLVWF